MKSEELSPQKIFSDCLERPDLIRFVPLAYYYDFDNNPLSELTVNGFSNPQIRNERITLAWGMGVQAGIKFPPPLKKIKHITFQAKSHPGRGNKPWPFKVLLNDIKVLDAKMRPGWKQFSFSVQQDQISASSNELVFIYPKKSRTSASVSEDVKPKPAAAFDFIYLSEIPFDYKIRYSFKKKHEFTVNGENRRAYLEPIGSTYWFEQKIPNKFKIQFGVIIDAEPASQPFELDFLYNHKGRKRVRTLKLDNSYKVGNGRYEGFFQIPFPILNNMEFGLRISGPGNNEYLGKAGFYLLNVVIPD